MKHRVQITTTDYDDMNITLDGHDVASANHDEHGWGRYGSNRKCDAYNGSNSRYYSRGFTMKKIFAGIAGFMLVFGLAACSGSKHVSETYPLHEIVLNQETSMHGNFFLISGGVGTSKNAYYYFYIESPDGTLQLHKNKYSDIVLKLEPEGTAPFVRCSGSRDEIEPGKRFNFNAYGTYDLCVFHVPESAIGHETDIDIKNIK